MSALVCPNCMSPDKLWVGGTFEGWHDVEVLFENGRAVDHLRGDHEAESADFTPDGNYGCAGCDWRGTARQLVRLDLDGKPLAKPLPGQEALPV